MGETNCDECGTTPYLGSTAIDESLADGAELWCDCPTSVGVSVKPNSMFETFPERWGMDGGEVRCYRCGAIPEISTSGSPSPNGPVVNYRFSCRCDQTTFGPLVQWEGTMPNEWKDDSDYTKWPANARDDIYEVIDAHGPIDVDGIQERVGIDDAGVRTLVTRMDHSDQIYCNTNTWEYMTDPWDVEPDEFDTDDTDDDGDDGGLLGWLR